MFTNKSPGNLLAWATAVDTIYSSYTKKLHETTMFVYSPHNIGTSPQNSSAELRGIFSSNGHCEQKDAAAASLSLSIP